MTDICNTCSAKIGDTIYFAFDHRFCSTHCRSIRVNTVSLRQATLRGSHLVRKKSESGDMFNLPFEQCHRDEQQPTMSQ